MQPKQHRDCDFNGECVPINASMLSDFLHTIQFANDKQAVANV